MYKRWLYRLNWSTIIYPSFRSRSSTKENEFLLFLRVENNFYLHSGCHCNKFYIITGKILFHLTSTEKQWGQWQRFRCKDKSILSNILFFNFVVFNVITFQCLISEILDKRELLRKKYLQDGLLPSVITWIIQ